MNGFLGGLALAGCLLATGGLARTAVTGIEGYNDAVRRGDLAAATEAAVALWPQVAGDADRARCRIADDDYVVNLTFVLR
jgi:hypothetical protein